MDKNDIEIFKEDKCIITSDSVNKDIVSNIVKEINYRHGYRIDDIVEVLGLIFYRPDFEKKFNINFQEIKERAMRLSKEMGDLSDIDKIYKNNKVMFDIDEILDKINKVGIENLTNEEKEFLNNFNR